MAKILIFGATSAIAVACARLWAAQGHSLFLVGRNPSKLATVQSDLGVRKADQAIVGICQADLDHMAQHVALFEEAQKTLGGIDIVFVAHGSLPDQKACEQSVDKTLSEIHTNALSVISLSTVASQYFEKQQRGVLAVISSVAGDRGRQSNYVYGAAKGLVSIFLAGLRNRLTKQGITVLTIKPGFVDTPMTAHIEKKGALWAQPGDVAQAIVTAIDRKKDVVYLPGIWRWIMLIITHIPEAIFKRLSL